MEVWMALLLAAALACMAAAVCRFGTPRTRKVLCLLLGALAAALLLYCLAAFLLVFRPDPPPV